MGEQVEAACSIFADAERRFEPYAKVVMFSGGDDSLVAYHVAREIADLDFVLHIRTGTGITDTLEFVQDEVDRNGDRLVIADAGDAYEKYVLRKGFFGRGRTAHNYAYHILKAQPFRTAISKQIRHGKRGRNVLLINGARKNESDNRTVKLNGPYNRDTSTKSNIWTSILYTWSKQDCLDFLASRGIERNPVSQAMHRSGECMCGTMQSHEDRRLAAALYPEWGEWLDDLEQQAFERGFTWGWGEATTKESPAFLRAAGQMEFMCMSCSALAEEGE